ncbi:unnamed protein product, partial [marine sediment metagenome]
MKIQNAALAGLGLSLRYTRDPDSGVSVVVIGDDRGVFDVPDKDGEFLCGTPGWKAVRAARAVSSAPAAAPAAPAPPPAAPEPPAPAEEPEEPDTEEEDEEDEDEP